MNYNDAEERIRLISRRNSVTHLPEYRVVLVDEVGAIRVRSGSMDYGQAKALRSEWIALGQPVPGTAELVAV
jgi:hypothetical protein